MLPILELQEETAHPLQAMCPWINFVTDNVVLNKDGSLLAAFEYQGIDPDDLTTYKVDWITKQIEAAYAQLDMRVTAWWIMDKRRDYTYPEGEFVNARAKELDDIYSKGFKNGKHYTLKYTFYMLFTGDTGINKFFERVARIQRDSGRPIGGAVIDAIKESLSGRAGFARDAGVLREKIHAFERVITTFVNAAPLKFKQLGHDEFSASLATLLNRASPIATHVKPRTAMLDSWAPENYVAAGPDLIQFKGSSRTVYAAALGVIKWPSTTSPMLFEALSKLDVELTVCQVVRFLNVEQSTAAINEAIEYYKLTQYDLVTHALAKAFNQVPESRPGKTQLLEDCNHALERIGAEGITYAYHNLTVFVYGDSQNELKRNVTLASQKLSEKRFGVIRERENTLPSFAAMLPGQWAMQTRYELLAIDNVADCSPVYTMDEGSRIHSYFSEMVYSRAVPTLTTFANTYGGRANFTSHVDQVGHMIIIAPTGGGKTTFVNFCLSQFQRYGHVNTFIFDRNLSCKIVTSLHGGRHIDIKTGNGRFNPFFAMMDGSADGKLWVREFVLNRFREGGFVATTENRAQLDEALQHLEDEFKSNSAPLSMSRLAALLPKDLEQELGEWLAGRPYGMFDCEEDDFSISTWTTVEMKDILAVDRLARAFMDYAFRKIYVSLDGTPTFIYLEEATFLLNNENFRDIIDDWLKTFRKKNAFLWLTIQSPQSITSKEISASILDNIFSFLLLFNKKVEPHRKAYKENFGLEDHHVDLVGLLQPKRDYLLIQNGKSRILRSNFDREALAYLRSEETVLKRFHEHERSGVRDWQEKYLAEVSLM